MGKFQSEVRLLSLKRTTWKQRRDILASERGLQLNKVITPPVIYHLSWYVAVVLVPASAYNKSLITQTVTKQELTKYQPSQNPTYQIDSLKKETNKKLLSTADSLVDKILSCPRIKLSNSQTLNFNSVETGISLLELLNNCVVKTQNFLTFTLLYLTTLVYLRLWFWIRMPRIKREEAKSLSKSERQKLHGCTHRVVLLMGLGASWWKLAICQYQRWDNFCIQDLPIKSLPLPRVNSKEWRRLLDSKMKLGERTWHTLTN